MEFGEVHVFVGTNFVITVRHSEAPDLSAVRHRLESDRDLLRRGPEAVLYAIVDRVVDGYYPVVAGLANDIDEIEIEVFGGVPQVSRRIYELSREVTEFQRATRPLTTVLSSLTAGFAKYGIDEELQRYLRDVDDHLTQVIERVEEFRQLLRDMLTVNATLVAQQQNDEMRNLAVGEQRPERGSEEDLRVGGHPVRTHADRHRVRDELREHARARLAPRLPGRARSSCS